MPFTCATPRLAGELERLRDRSPSAVLVLVPVPVLVLDRRRLLPFSCWPTVCDAMSTDPGKSKAKASLRAPTPYTFPRVSLPPSTLARPPPPRPLPLSVLALTHPFHVRPTESYPLRYGVPSHTPLRLLDHPPRLPNIHLYLPPTVNLASASSPSATLQQHKGTEQQAFRPLFPYT